MLGPRLYFVLLVVLSLAWLAIAAVVLAPGWLLLQLWRRYTQPRRSWSSARRWF
jgi:hypothetical protein